MAIAAWSRLPWLGCGYVLREPLRFRVTSVRLLESKALLRGQAYL